jgi:cytochrome c oxidase subunit I+III
LLLLSLLTLWIALGMQFHAVWETDLRPDQHGYAATVYTMIAWQLLHAVLLTFMALYCLARHWCGLIDAQRRNTFDNTRIMWYFCCAQAVIALLVMNSVRLG